MIRKIVALIPVCALAVACGGEATPEAEAPEGGDSAAAEEEAMPAEEEAAPAEEEAAPADEAAPEGDAPADDAAAE